MVGSVGSGIVDLASAAAGAVAVNGGGKALLHPEAGALPMEGGRERAHGVLRGEGA